MPLTVVFWISPVPGVWFSHKVLRPPACEGTCGWARVPCVPSTACSLSRWMQSGELHTSGLTVHGSSNMLHRWCPWLIGDICLSPTPCLPSTTKILHDTAVSPLISSSGDHHQMLTCPFLWYPLVGAYVTILPMICLGKGRHGLPVVAGVRNGRQIYKATDCAKGDCVPP